MASAADRCSSSAASAVAARRLASPSACRSADSPAVRLQHQRPGAGDQRVVLLGMLRLQRQPADLGLELGDQIGDAGQVVARPRQPGQSLVLADSAVLDAGRLFEQLAALFGPQGEGRVDRALPNHH